MNTISMRDAAKAWGDGKEVQWQDGRQMWHDIQPNGHCFTVHNLYRIKPEITTSLPEPVLYHIYHAGRDNPNTTGLRAVADAAIKQYIKEQTK